MVMKRNKSVTVIEVDVEKIIKSIEYSILESKRNLYDACKILADLHEYNPKKYTQVRNELCFRKILTKSTISYLTSIGSYENGFLLKSHTNLPIAYNSLYTLTRLNKKDIETKIKSGELSSDTTLEEIRSWVSDDSDDQIEFVDKKVKKSEMLKSIEISIPQQIINSKLELIQKHLDQIKKLMKYANVEEVGILKKRINDD